MAESELTSISDNCVEMNTPDVISGTLEKIGEPKISSGSGIVQDKAPSEPTEVDKEFNEKNEIKEVTKTMLYDVNIKNEEPLTSDAGQAEVDNNKVSIVKKQPNENQEGNTVCQPELTSSHDYELVEGHYYYTDNTSGQRYKFDANAGEWVMNSEEKENENKDEQKITRDSEGRTYYYAENMYLCKDPFGNVFYLNDNHEWKPWSERVASCADSGEEQNTSKWYFYQGDSMFYRDNLSNIVYKLNKESNTWEVYEGKLKRKKPRIDEEEEFDTDEEDSDEEFGNGLQPPGARSDPNINYDGVMYTKLDPSDNMMYEWDANRRAWFPKVDEDFMATYQLSYGFNPDGTKNLNPLKFDDGEEEAAAARLAEEEEKKAKAKLNQVKKKPTWFEMDDDHNTKVYVSNLPDSMTEHEFIELMQKCGMILKDIDTNKPKIKMYRDEEGNFKGDALCTYIKVESVNLAMQILDEYQVGNKKIHVEKAKFQQKGEYNPKLKPRKKQKKILEKIQKRQEKLFDWRPEPLRGQRQKNENTVVIRNAFDPREFVDAMEKMLVHKETLRNQCENFGKIKKMELHDLHPDGVVQVTFEEVEFADMCIATLNRRLYNGRTLHVSVWDGKEKFKIEETEAEREERLKRWSKFLESGENTDN
nr:HIV Tat-specific factor 1 homolog [Procambarus clarkii]XP_045626345.1 HIV Tat-specific factor 1 homolog [Procambarus clarkii]XP_045626346.1 HIV Tat-specific factor 1 homolog [Procambarus clarkii]XP_045626347.1 HIV Tat-specific factor 1 homolog [Procambarus clarkii]XP_045626348.1 HIV Tat-specific factor 1 homolog [Procambarus clarkii]